MEMMSVHDAMPRAGPRAGKPANAVSARTPLPLYTAEQRRRRDATPWTLVQGVLAPLQFLIFAVSLYLVLHWLRTGENPSLPKVGSSPREVRSMIVEPNTDQYLANAARAPTRISSRSARSSVLMSRLRRM